MGVNHSGHCGSTYDSFREHLESEYNVEGDILVCFLQMREPEITISDVWVYRSTDTYPDIYLLCPISLC